MKPNRLLILILFLLNLSNLLAKPSEPTNLQIADSLFSNGKQLYQHARYDSSNYFFTKVTEIYSADKNTELDTLHVQALNGIGMNLIKLARYDSALAQLEMALTEGNALLGGEHVALADIYNSLGIYFYQTGDIRKVLHNFEKSLEIRIKNLGESHPDVASSYNNIGFTYQKLGDFEQALAYYQKSLKLKRELLGENNLKIAFTYKNIGNLYRDLGDYERAIEFSNKALNIRLQEYGENHNDVANSYNDLGVIYEYMGNINQSLACHLKCRSILIKLYGEDAPFLWNCYHNLSSNYKSLGDYTQALEFANKSLKIKLSALGEKHPKVANTYQQLASIYTNLNEWDKALENLNRAREIRQKALGEKHPHVGITIYHQARIFYLQQQYQQGLESVQQALQIFVSDFNDSSVFANPQLENIRDVFSLLRALKLKAELFYDFYFVDRKNLQFLITSLETNKLAVRLLDKMNRIYETERSRLSLREYISPLFQQAVDCAVELYNLTHEEKYLHETFFLSEKGKAAILLTSFQDLKAQKLGNIPDSLLNREKELRIDFAYYEVELQEAMEKNQFEPNERIIELQNHCFELNAAHQTLINQLEVRYPNYYQLKYDVQPAAIQTLQASLDSKTAVLDYFFGKERLHIFCITDDTTTLASVPIDSTFSEKLASFLVDIKKINFTEFQNKSRWLHQILLNQMSKLIASRTSLVIIPHQSLYKLPFDALISDEAGQKYLIQDFDISYHYSATLFQRCMKNKGKRNKYSFIGFAPVFGKDNLNQLADENLFQYFQANVTDSLMRSLDRQRILALPHSEKEVRTIVQLFREKGFEANGFYRHQASEFNFKGNVGNYQFVHVATHSVIDEVKPELSSIIFSQPDSPFTPEDGILHAIEAYNLNLKADLLVLSSCESGIGKLLRGEGLMAFTRGFLYAGAQNLVVSLWKVSDRQTQDLMIEFYKNILSGQSYAGSLRNAKLKMLHNKATAFPKSWSSFVLIGQ